MSDGKLDPERAASRVRELQARFGASLRERLDRLEALVGAARGDAAEGALAEALVAAHRLAGTAGSYGHVEVGEAAAALEAALHRLTEGSPDRGAREDGAWAAGAWKDVLDALARVRAAASASRLG